MTSWGEKLTNVAGVVEPQFRRLRAGIFNFIAQANLQQAPMFG